MSRIVKKPLTIAPLFKSPKPGYQQIRFSNQSSIRHFTPNSYTNSHVQTLHNRGINPGTHNDEFNSRIYHYGAIRRHDPNKNTRARYRAHNAEINGTPERVAELALINAKIHKSEMKNAYHMNNEKSKTVGFKKTSSARLYHPTNAPSVVRHASQWPMNTIDHEERNPGVQMSTTGRFRSYEWGQNRNHTTNRARKRAAFYAETQGTDPIILLTSHNRATNLSNELEHVSGGRRTRRNRRNRQKSLRR